MILDIDIKAKRCIVNMNMLYRCIEKNKANNSHAREVIFRVLLQTQECLSVAQICNIIKADYPKRISVNTVYRHLNLFVACDLVIVLQNEDKKAHYCIADENNKVFTLCPQCGAIEKENTQAKVLFTLLEHTKTLKYITLHKRCKVCEGGV